MISFNLWNADMIKIKHETCLCNGTWTLVLQSPFEVHVPVSIQVKGKRATSTSNLYQSVIWSQIQMNPAHITAHGDF